MKAILVIVVVAAVMAGAAFFTVKQVVLPMFGPGASTDGTEAAGDTAVAKQGEGEVYLIEDLLINPKGTEGTRYLSTSLGLEVSSPAGVEHLRERDLQVRDLLISVLSSRTVTQLTSTTERETMRLEIQERLNSLLKGDQLLAVYFVDYVMQ